MVTVESQGGVRQTSVSQFLFQSNTGQEHTVGSEVLRPGDLLLPFSRIRKFIATDAVGLQEWAIHLTPAFQLLLVISNPCLVNCTVAHLLHVVSTFVACAIHKKDVKRDFNRHVHCFAILFDVRPIICKFQVEP